MQGDADNFSLYFGNCEILVAGVLGPGGCCPSQKNSKRVDITLETTLNSVNLVTRIPKKFGKYNLVILGAGFSKEYSYPLADQLMKDICTKSSQNSQRMKDLIRFVTHFYQDFDIEKQNYPDIEDFLGMLDVAEHYANIRSSSNIGYYWRENKVTELKNGIKRMICDYLWSFQKINVCGDLSKIFKMVEYFNHKTIYINFNYDLLLETALSKNGIKYCYGISGDPDIISILKPHGSINWFYRGRFKPHEFSNLINYGETFLVTNTLNFEDIEQCKGRDPVIISPTPSKRIEDHDLKKVWTGFSSSVHNAKTLTIIGYSLPKADRLTRLVIRRAGPKHQNCKRITIVRRSDHEAEYKNYISPYARQIKSSFGDWVSTLD